MTNPVSAGAFVSGHTRQRKTVNPDGQIRTRTELLPISQWRVCLPDHHPGYITWDGYLATQERLRANARARGEGGGAAREGSALLQGLIRCGHCGRRMMVAYSGDRGRAGRYVCSRTFQQQGTRRPCQAIGALRVDRAVAQAFLDAVTPAGVDATADALETLRPRRAPRGFSASRSSAPPTRPSGHVAGTTPASRKTASSPARSPLEAGPRRARHPAARRRASSSVGVPRR